MANEDIRCMMGGNCVRYWQVAKELGKRDSEFSRMLRYELTPEKKVEVYAAINEVIKERKKK